MSRQVVIRGGRLVDAATGATSLNAGIVVEDGCILGLECGDELSAAEEVELTETDCILPGLVNLHDHFTYRATFGRPRISMEAPQNRQAFRAIRSAHLSLARGITTVRELGSRHGINNAVRDAIAEKAMLGPRVFTAGTPLSITGGHAWYLGKEVDGVQGVRVAVRDLAKGGSDWVKIMASHDPVATTGDQATVAQYSSEELVTIVEEAHVAGLRVAAHAMGTLAIQRCIDAGVDTIEHGVYLNDEQAAQMHETNIALVPTISSYRRTVWPVYERGEEWAHLHAKLIEPHNEAVERAVAAGVTIGIGTDSVGEFVEEMAILIDCGLSVPKAIWAATSGGAAILGREHVFGSIEPGMIADLIVVSGDPTKDVTHLRDVRYVVREGVVLTPPEFRVSLMSSELAPGL